MVMTPPNAVFDIVGDMEDDLAAATSFADAIALIAETIDDGAEEPIQRLAWEIKDRVALAEEKRGKLFHMTHPGRERFEREGWPGRAEINDAAA
jgi:hypothetical protein